MIIVKNLASLYGSPATRARVVAFQYRYYKHDPYPVILTTGLTLDGRIGGLNLHYLTFPVFRALLNQWAGNPGFGYLIVKSLPQIKFAFRTYDLSGVQMAKEIDWRAAMTALSVVRNYSPQEVQAIRNAIDQQILSRRPELLDELFGRLGIDNGAPQTFAAPAPAAPAVGTEGEPGQSEGSTQPAGTL